MNLNQLTRFLFAISMCFYCVGCVNEALEIDPVAQSELIPEESELFLYLTQVTGNPAQGSSVTCIDFIYSFNVYVYDEFDTYAYSQSVSSDLEFWQFLQGVSEDYSVGISFPIQAVLEDGSEFLIENKDQLAQAIQSCITEIQAQVLGDANETFVACGWEVHAVLGDEVDMYEYSAFKSIDDNNLVYYKEGQGAPGTFIFYFIANQLHVNINIDSTDEALETFWNRDWVVTNFNENLLSIANEDDRYDLIKICEPDIFCTNLLFEVCEDSDGSETANFIFKDYSFCVGYITGQPFSDYTFDYFETLEDAKANTLALPQTGYTNIENAQTIYVRITNNTDATWSITQIVIAAKFCED